MYYYLTHPLRQHPDLARAFALAQVFFTTDSQSERAEVLAEALDLLSMVDGSND
jgi:2-oxo-4-hydroxy-4-carboxy--5-ureidoimidazoline (OHCU) decarboxylase